MRLDDIIYIPSSNSSIVFKRFSIYLYNIIFIIALLYIL